MKIGFLNAWLLSAPLILVMVIFMFASSKDVAKRLADTTGFAAWEKFIAHFTAIFNNLLILLCTFIPLQPSHVLFYPSLGIYLLGLILVIATIITYSKTPLNQAATTGVYRFSRNPLYTANIFIFIGICGASMSLGLCLLLVLLLVPQHFQILAEERACIHQYGDEYQKHLKKTPRYLFI